ncbi:MAG: glycerol-3-phosphate 1-O-acyltransferase PlsY [Pseudanabaena sp.]|jgi:glycerol-3-phosphate acyltransferase PlsY|uniref:glycerol-3-phosphate 1-O-acyltransferase PlsY n=1 Tax=Pseudanabaena mucicola TaxID=71190 RepID=UPI0025788D36|nr:glycerol-3-phosphate 1-O-acyltransferase PlsY [Pseudanabaena mucicola]MCA6574898.1 glycerol-3-phosphate 1-O-acyltransferase PlsY [Pseudanabaena sp. M53BS1SP1A06MG]MCA6580862.1 glycerol-3-phosphate 1-O-acyltransferase PlsY [Pseudanabaena sp. M34BS1SP1A06MG]MCA6586694.1 glycerol-3-phosphate 1-O-acyltransferase PlsY [Pseudanabaena sp. M051S1SP1A06QC]MCA6588579.1 glycerol-3-phosphate 1-O-acyltransferase PlsY [Pseudanabaena sp. M109S1SP1A06QC]MCA6594021.1 glycerol-3-phosphate 1-O-acyltransferase
MWFPYLLLALAYLLGSFPTGYLVGRIAGIDIREHGSGSTGATNVWRNVGKLAGISVFAVDFAKGAIAIYVMQQANWLLSSLGLIANIAIEHLSLFVIGAGMLALIGHSRPIWLGFKGGKSVATGVGVLFMLNWTVAIAAFSVWLVTMAIWRTVSISSISAATAAPILMWTLQGNIAYSCFVTVGCIFVIWLHRSNIERILNGTELTFKSDSKA